LADAPQADSAVRAIKSGDTVDVTVAGQYPLSGEVGYVLTEEKTVQVVINSPRGRWSLLLPDTWIVPRNGHWHVQIP
jgi:hypothetical protein